MIRKALLGSCFALLANPHFAAPTTVLPIRFDDLVSKAEVIFVGEAIENRSMHERRRDAPIVTVVTFSVIRVLKGQVGLRTELEFLGGTVGNEMLEVAGMPRFEVGNRDVLFVSSQRGAISPLVGFWHGRFRIVRDPTTGEEQVRAYNGAAVSSRLAPSAAAGVATFGPVSPADARGASLSLREFELLIRDAIRLHK